MGSPRLDSHRADCTTRDRERLQIKLRRSHPERANGIPSISSNLSFPAPPGAKRPRASRGTLCFPPRSANVPCHNGEPYSSAELRGKSGAMMTAIHPDSNESAHSQNTRTIGDRRLTLKSTLAAAFLLQVVVPIASQQSATVPTLSSSWCASLPASERQTFLQIFNGAISLREHGDWSGLYDLMHNAEGYSRAQFSRKMSALNPLVDFQPVSITYIPPSDKWLIKGNGRFRSRSGREHLAHCSMQAYELNNRWLFDDIAIDVVGGK